MANDYNDKKYYWIKLKDSFMTSDTVDFLMSQKDGANYVVLYQMLCLKSVNNEGELSRTIGEVIIPFDADKIQRDCKWFTKDTIIVALELYKKLKLIYMQESGVLHIADFKNLIGSESQSNVYKKQKKALEKFQPNSNKRLEIRDKRLDTINKSIDNRNKIGVERECIGDKSPRTPVFVPPILQEIENYCKERGNDIEPRKFYDYFTASDWVDSKGNKVRNWKQKIITWEGRNGGARENTNSKQHGGNVCKDDRQDNWGTVVIEC